MKAEDLVQRRDVVAGWPVNVVSYRLGEQYYCTIDNVDPGARIAEGHARTRDEAERFALEAASREIAKTRRFPR